MAFVSGLISYHGLFFPTSSFSRISAVAKVPASVNPSREFGPFEEGPLKQPRYSGDNPTSKLVNILISIKPLFGLMKLGARKVIIGTAEKKGIMWRQMSKELLAADVYSEKEMLEDKSVVYPDYYLKEFHAYENGNLSWQAASEAECATMSMISRAIPTVETFDEAVAVLRGNWLHTIQDHHLKYSDLGFNQIIDIGCSVGASTVALADHFPTAQVAGLDLSPYFLAVAQYKEKQRAKSGVLRRKCIQWIHANGETSNLPSCSFDIVSLAFVIHECPSYATRGLLKEAYRILKPGGTIAITDNSPKSKIIQNLPPVLFTLQKSTEPWMDEYYSLDLLEIMQDTGFIYVNSILTDPRHHTTTGTVPLSK